MKNTIKLLMASNKGILAMDESIKTCNERFAVLSIPQTFEARRAYRELLITTGDLHDSISGAILCDETCRQKTKDGVSFIDVLASQEIVVGIKVDLGVIPLALHPKEKMTEGLDGLGPRLQEYKSLGARFAKWRALINIDRGSSSKACVSANANSLARYAALCQEVGLVAIVEPEVSMLGPHSLQTCSEVTENLLRSVFQELFIQKVDLETIILKPNMVLSGSTSLENFDEKHIAEATVACLLRSVPAAVPAIAFLSGGQSSTLASSRLSAMNQLFEKKLPWSLGFSFGRALHQDAMNLWRGQDENISKAQQSLYHQAHCNTLARQGKFSERSKTQGENSFAVLTDPKDHRSTEILE